MDTANTDSGRQTTQVQKTAPSHTCWRKAHDGSLVLQGSPLQSEKHWFLGSHSEPFEMGSGSWTHEFSLSGQRRPVSPNRQALRLRGHANVHTHTCTHTHAHALQDC